MSRREVKAIVPKYGEKTEYYAIPHNPAETLGPWSSLSSMDKELPEGEFSIVTKVKKVVVS